MSTPPQAFDGLFLYQMNLQNRNRFTDLEIKLMVAGGRMESRDSQGVWNEHVYTAMFKMDNQQGSIV